MSQEIRLLQLDLLKNGWFFYEFMNFSIPRFCIWWTPVLLWWRQEVLHCTTLKRLHQQDWQVHKCRPKKRKKEKKKLKSELTSLSPTEVSILSAYCLPFMARFLMLKVLSPCLITAFWRLPRKQYSVKVNTRKHALAILDSSNKNHLESSSQRRGFLEAGFGHWTKSVKVEILHGEPRIIYLHHRKVQHYWWHWLQCCISCQQWA